MKPDWLKVMVGKLPLPNDTLERCQLLEFADSHHVLGQVAAVWAPSVNGKTYDVLNNGLYRASFDHGMLRFEMGRIERAFIGSGIEPILLKGASYVAKGLKAGEGRRVSDIDILVSEEDLVEVERLLLAAGWAFDEATNNEYDQNYYRTYMHELPPLRHNLRRTVIDVHHRILPRTSRVGVNSAAFISGAIKLPGHNLKVLTEIDTFLHSAIHTFADGSLDTPARSFIELHYLFADIPVAEHQALLERAHIVGAEMPLAAALWGLKAYFSNEQAQDLLSDFKLGVNPIVCWAYMHKLENVSTAKLAKLLLYIRSHYLRMSLPRLTWHILTKSYKRLTQRPNLPLPPGFE